MELGPAHISVNRCHSMHIITEPELEPFPSYITLSWGGTQSLGAPCAAHSSQSASPQFEKDTVHFFHCRHPNEELAAAH